MFDTTTILLVDDDKTFTELFQIVLKRRGFTYRITHTVKDAISIVDAGFFPEAAMVDLLVPSGESPKRSVTDAIPGFSGGLSVVDYLVQHDQRCRVIVHSALDEYREPIQRAGAWAYFQKPFLSHELHTLLSYLKQGYLRDEEIGMPTVYLNEEIRRSGLGKER